MVTMETANNALKTFYLDAVTEAIDKKANPLLARIGKTSSNVVGKEVKKLVKVGLNGGISAGSETGDLPESNSGDRIVLTATLKNLYGTIQISDKALRASANNEGAFVNLLNDEMEDLVKSANLNFGRMLFGDGSGFVGTATSMTDDPNVANVMDAEGLMEGTYVDILSFDGSSVYANNYKVVWVDRETQTAKFSGLRPLAEVFTGKGIIYIHNSKGYEITGLKAVFDSSNLYGVNKDEYPMMKPYEKILSAAISETEIQKAIDKIEEASGSRVNYIVCSWGVKRAISKYFREQGVMLPTMTIDGGYNALNYNGIPIVGDRFCPSGYMYLLNTDDFKLHQLCDWKWLEGEDGKVLKQIPGKPVYTATLVKYAELVCERPNGQGLIRAIHEA